MKHVETLLLVICISMMWKQHDQHQHDDDQDDEHNDISMMRFFKLLFLVLLFQNKEVYY